MGYSAMILYTLNFCQQFGGPMNKLSFAILIDREAVDIERGAPFRRVATIAGMSFIAKKMKSLFRRL